MADACWAQLLTYDHHIIFDSKYVFLDMTIRSWCLSRNPWCWSHNYVFWTEVIGFDNTFLDFRWKSLIVTILQWFLNDNRWFWPYCNSFWREIIYFDNTCTTFVQKSMILVILSWFLLKKCNFDNTVLFLIRNQAFWTYCRAFWCLSVWPECSAGDLSLARPAQPGQASQASLARPGQPGRAQPGGLPAGQTRPRGSWEANFFFDSWKKQLGPTFCWQLKQKLAPTCFWQLKKKVGPIFVFNCQTNSWPILAGPEGPKGHVAFFGRASRAGEGKTSKLSCLAANFFFDSWTKTVGPTLFSNCQQKVCLFQVSKKSWEG